MKMKIALAGNPNCGKTTLFNALTGANQFVGNWPGVTVEKKEGRLKKHDAVTLVDLPGVYSLSPYTMEEVVARDYLVEEQPDAILNIVDGVNLERNLYLTTQLMELGIPVVVAVNMMDLVRKSGDKIKMTELSRRLGCQVVEISALKGDGVEDAAQAAVQAAQTQQTVPAYRFGKRIEGAIQRIEEQDLYDMPGEQRRWYAIKVFERDERVLKRLALSQERVERIEKEIREAEKACDDDAESIITNERYLYIAEVLKGCYQKKRAGALSVSDKIDRVVTNRWLGLPVFAVIMFFVYYLSMVGVGTAATDWANDGLFGDGWHLLGIGSAAYTEDAELFASASETIDGFIAAASERGIETEAVERALDSEAEGFTPAAAEEALKAFAHEASAMGAVAYHVVDEETMADEVVRVEYDDLLSAAAVYQSYAYIAPDPGDYGVWIPGIPVLIEQGLTAIHTAEWLQGLILDGIVAGVGGVLGFVPQMLVLFLLLAVLEACGYMARIAFVLDRIFRKFGLSGKSFIPMLIGTGCGVPGIMASRTIENERDRRMTIMTTTFIPCGAKIPFISMIAGAIFGGSAVVATSAYFVGMAAVMVSGIMLKKTRMFAGEPAPFVMELPAYHLPLVSNVLRSMWERGWSFIKKAGTIILLSTVVIWFATYFGFAEGRLVMLTEDQIDQSILAAVGSAVAWIFAPLGWGSWQAAVASVTGLIAKENIVGTMGVLYGGTGTVYGNLAEAFTQVSGYSFMVFNLLCAPCFAAIGAIRREMNSARWTWFAIGYQCIFAYAVSLMIYQFGSCFVGEMNLLGLISAVLLMSVMLYMLFKPEGKNSRIWIGMLNKRGV